MSEDAREVALDGHGEIWPPCEKKSAPAPRAMEPHQIRGKLKGAPCFQRRGLDSGFDHRLCSEVVPVQAVVVGLAHG